jgi:Zn-dependent protease with chaperone function
MPFLLLLVLTLTYLQTTWPAPLFTADPLRRASDGSIFVMKAGADKLAVTSIVLTCAGAAVLMAAAEWLVRRFGRLLRQDPSQRYAVSRRFARCRRYHLYALLSFHCIALYVFGWGWTGKEYLATQAGLLPGRELLLIAPFFSVLIFAWTRFYDVECATHREESNFPGRWSHLGLQLRHNLLLVLPPLLLFLIQETVLFLLPELGRQDYVVPMAIFAACLVAGIFITIPWLLRVVLGLRPLAEGPLRTRLLETARRLKFRCNDILLWNTRSTMANAMVAGPSPFLRYVVLTDRLIEDLTPEEVEAVFGHEVGHIKHHHMLFYLGFVLVSLLALGAVGKLAGILFQHERVQAFLRDYAPVALEWVRAWDYLAAVPLLVVMGLYIFLVFGFLSRRCERQADIFGCRTVSCPIFIDALEKVALLNGIHRERPGWLSSWQHSTIARRVEFVARMHADPAVETLFQRRVGLVKWGVVLALGAILTGVVTVLFVLGKKDEIWSLFC